MPTLEQIADLLSLPVPRGAGARLISGVASLQDARPQDLAILKTAAYLKEFAQTRAGAVIVEKTIDLAALNRARAGSPAESVPLFFADDAELAQAKVMTTVAPPVPHPPVGVDPSAKVAPDAQIGQGSAVGSFVTIGAGARIGQRCMIHAGVFIGDNTTLGDDCQLFPNVVVRERVVIGQRVIIHAGSVLGSDGFGYRWDGRQHVKLPQIGTVEIEDDVEIGSCACVDRAKFGVTRVGRGSKIDNLVQVAHNVQIGPHCVLAGQAGVAGSSRLGAGNVLGGQCAVRDHVTLGDGAIVAACAGVAFDVVAGNTVSGIPALPHRQTLREQAALRRLPNLIVHVRELQEKIDDLTKRLEEQKK